MKEIPLTQGYIAIVDDDDYDFLCDCKWYVQKKGTNSSHPYAATKIKNKHVKMHRLLARAKGKEIVDHINGNTLDNRRRNLRIGDHKLNASNRRGSYYSYNDFAVDALSLGA